MRGTPLCYAKRGLVSEEKNKDKRKRMKFFILFPPQGKRAKR
jgi:hypothetical protein